MPPHNLKQWWQGDWHLDGPLLLCLAVLLLYGLLIFYSASGQNPALIARNLTHIVLGVVIMLLLSRIPPRIYQRWAPHLYLLCLALLLLVMLFGETTKGAQRWLNLGILRFQPSELAKLVVPLMVASFINREPCPPTLRTALLSLLLILLPTAMVAPQPDLGTAVLIVASGLFVLFLAGVSWRWIVTLSLVITLLIPTFWCYGLHDYQRARLSILLHPEHDPLGRGYHIIQSKIAIGSGGLLGKGWLHGTQSQLAFLPERHTDFIFAVLAEEFGFLGISGLLLIYLVIILRGFTMASQAQSAFAHLLIGGYTLLFFFYLFINIGMVSGLLPVVGVPLPLISYGGTSQIVLLASFGIMMSLYTHRQLLSKSP